MCVSLLLFDDLGVSTIHGHGGDLIGTKLIKSGAGGRRNAASAGGAALQTKVSADAPRDILVVAGKRADLVTATQHKGSAATGAGLDESNVAAEQSALAAFRIVILVGGQTESLGLGGHTEAGGVAKATAVFGGTAAHFDVVAIKGLVRAAHTTGHAVSRAASFFVRHGRKLEERKRKKG